MGPTITSIDGHGLIPRGGSYGHYYARSFGTFLAFDRVVRHSVYAWGYVFRGFGGILSYSFSSMEVGSVFTSSFGYDFTNSVAYVNATRAIAGCHRYSVLQGFANGGYVLVVHSSFTSIGFAMGFRGLSPPLLFI